MSQRVQLVVFAGLAVLTAIGAAGIWMFFQFYGHSVPLGGPCTAAIQCKEGAEYCLKPEGRKEGTCTKACSADTECGPGLQCRPIDIVETRGEQRTEWKGHGYCFRGGP